MTTSVTQNHQPNST